MTGMRALALAMLALVDLVDRAERRAAWWGEVVGWAILPLALLLYWISGVVERRAARRLNRRYC